MIVCPVCEHQQSQGDVCDVCGKQLVAGWGAEDAPVAPLDGLEGTLLQGVGAPVTVAALAELEVHRSAPAPEVPTAPIPELDLARAAKVPDAPILPLDEMELGRAEDDGQRTAVPTGVIACRYCRHEQAEGVFCDACGMRLPKAATPAALAARPARADEEIWDTCTKCGSRAMVGRRCGECGIIMTMPA